MLLLVVDDDPSVREALELVLDLNGFGVATAADGSEAIRTLSVDRPDAVILDVLMPGLDGLEVCRRMRAIGDRTPVLMLTARAEVSERVAGLEAGADDYLVKPFAAAELLARVRANIELARLRNHQARWRTALVDSLQEAFFVCDEHGVVVEINAAFTEVLGYGPEQLPYPPIHPWWPDADTDPDNPTWRGNIRRTTSTASRPPSPRP